MKTLLIASLVTLAACDVSLLQSADKAQYTDEAGNVTDYPAEYCLDRSIAEDVKCTDELIGKNGDGSSVYLMYCSIPSISDADMMILGSNLRSESSKVYGSIEIESGGIKSVYPRLQASAPGLSTKHLEQQFPGILETLGIDIKTKQVRLVEVRLYDPNLALTNSCAN